MHCRKGAQPVPKAVHHCGCCDRDNWLRPLTLQSIMPSLNHCDLPRHVGVNNLPKVVTRQHHGWELNLQPSSCKSNALIIRHQCEPSPPQSNTCFLGPVQVHIPNDISIGSALFAQLTAKYPEWLLLSPIKIAPHMGILEGLHVIHGSLGLSESTFQTTSRSVH